MHKETALKLMKEVREQFDKHKVKIWLNYGTLLGAVRDKGFIEWDDDVDMSAWYKDIDKIESIGKELYKKDYDVMLTNDTLRLRKEDVAIDVYLYQLFRESGLATKTNCRVKSKLGRIIHYLILEGVLIRYNTPKKSTKEEIIRQINKLVPKWLYKPAYALLLLCGDKYYRKAVPAECLMISSEIDFYGETFNIPTFTEKYLDWLYSSTWKNKTIDKWHQNFIKELEKTKQPYPKLHIQCPKCGKNYAINTYQQNNQKRTREIDLKCKNCNHSWKEKVFVVWTINNLKYNPFKVYT